MNLKLYKKYFIYSTADQVSYNLLTVVTRVAWPSGLRRWFKAPVSSGAWVRIPPLPTLLYTIQVSSSCILSSPELLAPIRQACPRKESVSSILFLTG